MKRIFLLTTLLLVLTGLVIAFIVYKSYSTVRFSFANSNYTTTISDKKGREVAKINAPQDIRLRNGDYFYSVSGTGINSSGRQFSVNGDTEVRIEPEYLSAYIATLTSDERPRITNYLTEKYPEANNIEVKKLTISKDASWAYGTLMQNNNTTVLYRFVLKRDRDTWAIAIKPTIAIHIDDNNGVPKDIIYSLYKD